jgi:hypothetical protein
LTEYNPVVRQCATAAVAFLALVAAAPSGASRAPTPAERSMLATTAVTYIREGRNHCCVLGLRPTAVGIRVSTVDPHWATVFVRVLDRNGAQVQPATVVLHFVSPRWRVFVLGNALLGCGVPKPVRADLHLTVPPSGHC